MLHNVIRVRLIAWNQVDRRRVHDDMCPASISLEIRRPARSRKGWFAAANLGARRICRDRITPIQGPEWMGVPDHSGVCGNGFVGESGGTPSITWARCVESWGALTGCGIAIQTPRSLFSLRRRLPHTRTIHCLTKSLPNVRIVEFGYSTQARKYVHSDDLRFWNAIHKCLHLHCSRRCDRVNAVGRIRAARGAPRSGRGPSVGHPCPREHLEWHPKCA